ncbi:MAG: hypothetical protein NZL83_01585 [Candidatus Absconditabacterales bacterium]|nr:hypothetical protein [Candidatus Absconditabacterales bacterium]
MRKKPHKPIHALLQFGWVFLFVKIIALYRPKKFALYARISVYLGGRINGVTMSLWSAPFIIVLMSVW